MPSCRAEDEAVQSERRASSLALPRCSNVTERKHYFEEGRRICSKIGGGMHGNVTVEEIDSRVPELAYNYDEQFHHQYDGIHHTFHDCIEADPQIIDGVNLHHMLVEREVQRDEDEPTYFYHSDHLGSAAYLTYHGGVIQTLNYLPYGEDWVEYNFFHPDDTTRLGIYRFNGKEKDYESGFHYYGARYYWSEVLTGWLSVDPMADKYPSISPYAYCAWNPIVLIDPDGMKFDSVSQIEVDKLKKQAVLNWYKGYKGDIESAWYQREYNSTLNEISILEKSKQEYFVHNRGRNIRMDGSKNGVPGRTIYKIQTNKLMIAYNGDIGTLSHELKHAFQFEIGNTSFDETGEYGGVLNDFYDEREAYTRGTAFGRPDISDQDIISAYSFDKKVRKTIGGRSPEKTPYKKLVKDENNIYRINGVTYVNGKPIK